MNNKHKRAPQRRGNTISEKVYTLIMYPITKEEFDKGSMPQEQIDKYVQNIAELFDNVTGKFQLIWAYHDKDIDEDGCIKLPHVHVILIFEREKSLNALAREIGCRNALIEWVENLPKAIEYLWHKNNPEKYQYDKSIVHSTCDIDKYIDKGEKLTETDELRLIMAYISKYENGLSLFDIYCFCVDNNVWSTYRRNYSIIKDMLNEARRTHSSVGYFTVFLTEEERKARGITFEADAHYEMAQTDGA